MLGYSPFVNKSLKKKRRECRQVKFWVKLVTDCTKNYTPQTNWCYQEKTGSRQSHSDVVKALVIIYFEFLIKVLLFNVVTTILKLFCFLFMFSKTCTKSSSRAKLMFFVVFLSQQHATVLQGWICSNNCMCCPTETEVDAQTCCLTSHSILTPGQPVLAMTL